MNISALNDTTFLAKRLVMWLAWKLGAWWKKKRFRPFCTRPICTIGVAYKSLNVLSIYSGLVPFVLASHYWSN